jgi:hypothetical protein
VPSARLSEIGPCFDKVDLDESRIDNMLGNWTASKNLGILQPLELDPARKDGEIDRPKSLGRWAVPISRFFAGKTTIFKRYGSSSA